MTPRRKNQPELSIGSGPSGNDPNRARSEFGEHAIDTPSLRFPRYCYVIFVFGHTSFLVELYGNRQRSASQSTSHLCLRLSDFGLSVRLSRTPDSWWHHGPWHQKWKAWQVGLCQAQQREEGATRIIRTRPTPSRLIMCPTRAPTLSKSGVLWAER